MEEKKTGMVWYNILRYFSFGFMRSLYGISAVLYFITALIAPEAESVFLTFYFGMIFTVFFIVHRHLENYSDSIIKVFLWYMIFIVIIDILYIAVDPSSSGSDIVSSVFYYFINRSYFKKRSHIFVNKCNFWGKIIAEGDIPAATEKYPVSAESLPESTFGHNFCRMCGTKLEPGDKFCNHCGTKINID